MCFYIFSIIGLVVAIIAVYKNKKAPLVDRDSVKIQMPKKDEYGNDEREKDDDK